MNFENKNFILAIVLSMLIIFGWQYFYAAPLQKKLEAQQPATQQTVETPATPGAPARPAGTVPGAAQSAAASRDEALKTTPRLKIETPSVTGSINLQGAQFDDLHLVKYRETIDPNSPTIVFLSPAGTPGALFAEQGFIPATGTTAKLPDTKTVWTAPEGAVLTEAAPVTLTWDNGEGLVFSRKIEISDEYLFTITQTVENKSQAPVALIPYGRVQRQDTPHVAGYWVFFEGLLGWLDGGLHELHYKDLAADGAAPEKRDTTGGWLGFTDKYWAATIIPDQTMPVTATFLHQKAGDRDIYQTDYLAKDALVAQPGATVSARDQLFAGAKVVQTINSIEVKHGIAGFDYMIDWGWFYFLTKPMFYLLDWLKGMVGNFGIAILLATVLVKAAVFPLANKSYASMSKMKKLQPEMEKLKQQYPDDKMKQQQGMMELYKKEKVSPLSGCLPVVVQIPVFFSLYKVILTSIELRHAPFFGWIHDLSAPDPTTLFNLFGLIPWTPPNMLMIGIWPLLMGITMWVQMRLNPTPPDPVQASLFNWMPVIFTFMLGTFPAGLVIYWAWSNTLSIIQQSYIMKRHGTEVNILGNIRDSLPFLKKENGQLTDRFMTDQIDAGRRLFGGPCRFLLGVARLDQLPEVKGVEIAFAGRSNVGKSSLINAVTGMRDLARASNTPGRTRELNFFDVNGQLTLVDMPGYGYAKASKSEVKKWQSVLRGYLRGRPGLTRVFVLIDARHGIKTADMEMFDLLDEAAVTYQLVLTKTDKIKPAELEKVMAGVEEAARKRLAAFPVIHATSSEKGTGIPELRAEIAGLL